MSYRSSLWCGKVGIWVRNSLSYNFYLPPGHRTYVGYLYLEYSTNNAVLMTFVTLLTKSLHAKRRRARQPRVELTTPSGLYNIHNHDRNTEKMAFARNGSTGSLEADGLSGGLGEVKGHEAMRSGAEEQLDSGSDGLDTCRKTTAYSALPNHCKGRGGGIAQCILSLTSAKKMFQVVGMEISVSVSRFFMKGQKFNSAKK